MERVFLLHSPRIAKIEVAKQGSVRRAKLYYLRGTSGKASKVKGKLGQRPIESAQEAPEALQEQGVENTDVNSNANEIQNAT